MRRQPSDSATHAVVAFARVPAQSRAERLIAGGRAVLAVTALVAIWLDPSTPIQHQRLTYVLLAAYALYALVLLLPAWGGRPMPRVVPLATHVIDLGAFSLFMYTTEGPTSPFFLFFVFALLCATVRWRWRGTVATGGGALVVFVAMGLYASQVLGDPAFELDRFLIRSAYLGVLTVLIAYLGWHEERVRGELAGLAAWPHSLPNDRAALIEDTLGRAAGILHVDRMALVLEDADEPWFYLDTWSRGRFAAERVRPGALQPFVDAALEGRDFLAFNLDSAGAAVLSQRDASPVGWPGSPLNPGFVTKLEATSAAVLVLRGESTRGWLLALDKRVFNPDDLVLGRIVARHVWTLIDQLSLVEGLRAAAATEERLRLARDLHDGVLQALAGTGLRLGNVRRDFAGDPGRALATLETLQDDVAAQQRELRRLIAELRPGVGPAPPQELGSEVEAVADRTALRWGVRVEVKSRGPLQRVPRTVAKEVVHLVQEALANAGRHAGASSVGVELAADGNLLAIVVADDGRGFGFSGRLDHGALVADGCGPRTLLERTQALGGSMAVESTARGSRVEITLPFESGGG